MEKSKIYNTQTNHSLDNVNVVNNIYTGRLTIQTVDLVVGSNNYEMYVGHVYNSQFKNLVCNNKPIGLGNGFKLNIQQYVLPYEESMNFEDFNEGDYLYIDEIGNIHRFIKYSNDNLYYDNEGTALILKLNSDSTKVITDENMNELVFDSSGRLTNIISGINSEINKKIEYSDNKIINFYDLRKPSNSIRLEYQNDKISSIYNASDRQYIYYKYDSSNRLVLIIKSRYEEKKDVCYFQYNEDNKITDIVDCTTLKAIRVEYSNDKVSVIKYKQGKIENITSNDGSLFYCGENLYIGSNIYIGESAKIINKNYLFDDASYEESITSFEYDSSVLTKEIVDGKTILYFFNDLGEVCGVFENISDSNDSFKYQSINKSEGFSLTINEDDIVEEGDNEINDEKVQLINGESNFYVNLTDDEYKYIKDNYITKFLLSCFISFDTINNNDLGISIYEDDQLVLPKASLGKLKNSWAELSIPVSLSLNEKNSVIKLNFVEENDNGYINNKKVYISNVKITPQNYFDTLIINPSTGETVNLNLIKGIKYVDENNQDILIAFDLKNFMTNYDLFNVFSRHNRDAISKNSFHDIVYCNNRKVVRGKNLNFILENSDIIPAEVGTQLANFNEVKITTISDSIYEKQTRTYMFGHDSNKPYYTIENEFLNFENSTCNQQILLEEIYQNGLYKRFCQDNKFYIQFEYDDYGNIISERKYHINHPNDVFLTTYEYYDTDYLRMVPDKITENNQVIECVYKTSKKILDSVIKGNLKIKYGYDKIYEKVQSVSFIDLLTNEEVFKNEIYYDDLGKIESFTDNRGITYCFDNKILLNSKKQKLFYNNSLIEEIELLKHQAVQYDGKTILSDITNKRNIYLSNQAKTIINHYKDNVLIQTEENDNNVIYSYESGILNNKRIKKINDSYSNNIYNYIYKEIRNGHLFNSYKIVDKDTDNVFIDIKDYKNIFRSYMFDIGLSRSKLSYSNNDLNLFYSDCYGTKLSNYVKNELESENSLYSKKAYLSMEYYQYLSSPILDYEYLYLYRFDFFNRVKKIVNPIVYSLEYNYISESIENIEYYDYNESNKLISTIENHIIVKNSEGVENDSAFVYNYSYDNGNKITSISEGGTYFSVIPTISTKATTLPTETINYRYDSFNRLISEENNDFGNLEFVYDDVVDEEEGTTGSGQLLYVKEDNEIIKRFHYNNGRLSSCVTNGYIDIYYYDNYGNMLNLKNLTFTYNDRNQLSKVNISNPYSSVEYEYNYQGIRHKKIYKDDSGTTTLVKKYYLDGARILREIWLNDENNIIQTLDYIYNASGICGIKYGDKSYHLLKDALGNILKIIYQGRLLAEYKYDAWGNQKIIEYAILDDSERFVVYNNPFRYRGYYYDEETNLALVSSRYYSPELGRFIQPADVSSLNPQSINGLNLYTYAFNNPIGVNYNSSASNGGNIIDSVKSSNNIGIPINKYNNINSTGFGFDPNFLGNVFSHHENIFAGIAGVFEVQRTYHNLPQIETLAKISKVLMHAGFWLNIGLSAYNNYHDNSLTKQEKWVSFIVDSIHTTGQTVGSYFLGGIPYAGPFLAICVPIVVDYLWSGELSIIGFDINVKPILFEGKTLEEWVKYWVNSWFD